LPEIHFKTSGRGEAGRDGGGNWPKQLLQPIVAGAIQFSCDAQMMGRDQGNSGFWQRGDGQVEERATEQLRAVQEITNKYEHA